ncbi:MAG TPA: AAA family ATPase [Solirubrobacteraceae bacterium]|nr:AAA family ATPase [Solirubrobacteraceae bacterium]
MVTRGGTVLVGRVHELAELDRALDSTEAGNGGAVLIAGEAGIGKTMLASELSARADERGFEVLLGRSIDLVGTELPYQPFLEALRPLGRVPHVDPGSTGSQLRMFQNTLGLLGDHAAITPLLLMLEDVHWADASTLDLFLFLAYNVADHRLLLLATYRPDELSSAQRMGRFAAAVRRSGSGFPLELGPLDADEVRALLAARAPAPALAALTEAIVARCQGNPFFAEELLTAAQQDDRPAELPRGLRDLLLQRVAQLDARTQNVLRLAAAAGRDVGYPLLQALAQRPEHEVHDSLRQAVDHAVLVPVEATGRFRFRHALLAEAIYATILPGEREELHTKLAEELSRSEASPSAELAPHWAAAGRNPEALAASVEAAREAEAVFGLAEARAHLERAIALWSAVPAAAELAGLDLAELYTRAAALARLVGDAARALELTRRAIELIGPEHPRRAGLLHVWLAEDLYGTGNNDAGLAALERAVELVPEEPPSPERAFALGSLAGGRMMAWRHAESLELGQRALALARHLAAGEAEVRALTVLGVDLAYLGRSDEGLPYLREALRLADEIGDRTGLERAYVNFTDTLTMLGRPGESAQLAQTGLEAIRRYGFHSTLLELNRIEALVAIGDWDEADRLSAAALRSDTSDARFAVLDVRASVEIGRGDFEAARAHLEAVSPALEAGRVLGLYGFHDAYRADLALWERRWTDAEAAVQEGLAHADQREAAQIRVLLCAQGLRAQAELAASTRARRDVNAVRERLARAGTLLSVARSAAAEASAITPNANGWLLLAQAEYLRARAEARPDAWAKAAGNWERLGRPPLAAYSRWRQAEALVATGASRPEASAPLREARSVAARIGATPLLREIDFLAERARLDLAGPLPASGRDPDPAEALGLTTREAEVLTLLARGYTNREIAAELVISVKTASVHVTHILQKLNAPNRREAAATLHRLSPPQPHRS